jgi:hypothetical protein
MTDPFPPDEPLTQAPEFPVEPRDKDPRSERSRQSQLVRQLRKSGLKVHATPNARDWGPKAWNDAMAEGVEWGAADLTVNGPGGRTAYIEMKNASEKPKQHQVDWLNSRHRLGFPVAVARSAGWAIEFLRGAGFELGGRDAG